MSNLNLVIDSNKIVKSRKKKVHEITETIILTVTPRKKEGQDYLHAVLSEEGVTLDELVITDLDNSQTLISDWLESREKTEEAPEVIEKVKRSRSLDLEIKSEWTKIHGKRVVKRFYDGTMTTKNPILREQVQKILMSDIENPGQFERWNNEVRRIVEPIVNRIIGPIWKQWQAEKSLPVEQRTTRFPGERIIEDGFEDFVKIDGEDLLFDWINCVLRPDFPSILANWKAQEELEGNGTSCLYWIDSEIVLEVYESKVPKNVTKYLEGNTKIALMSYTDLEINK